MANYLLARAVEIGLTSENKYKIGVRVRLFFGRFGLRQPCPRGVGERVSGASAASGAAAGARVI